MTDAAAEFVKVTVDGAVSSTADGATAGCERLRAAIVGAD